MRLRKNMKRTAAAVLALSMAVSVVAAPASAGYTIDMSDEKITGNVEIKQETEGSGTKITISVDGKDKTADFKNEDEDDKITITGDNTKPAAATTAAAEAAKDDTKTPETTVEENKDGTVIDYTGKQDAQPDQEASRPEGTAPDMEADPAGKDDQQKETGSTLQAKPASDPEADKDDPDDQSGQNDQNEDSEDEDADAGIMTYEAPAPTTITSAVEAAARKVISIINNATGKELAVTLKNLTVDAGDTAQNALTVSGTGNVTLELEGKNELTGGSGTFKGTYGDQKGYGIDATKNSSLTIKGNEGSSLTANGGAGGDSGGGTGIYANDLELDNADVTANGGSGGYGSSGMADGVYAQGQFNIKHSKLTATGGSKEVTRNKNVYGSRGIYSNKQVVIGEGSEVVATGGNVKSENGTANGGTGISFYYGGLEIQKGGKLTAIGGNAESEKGKANGGAGFQGDFCGMVSSGEATFIGGNAKSGSGNAVAGSGISGSQDNQSGNVTVKEGTTTALGGTAEGADGKVTNGNSFTGSGGTSLSIEKDATFVTAKPGESGGNGISGYVNNNGKIEEIENAKVDKKDDGTITVKGDLTGIKKGDHSYKLETTVEPTCTTPGKRVYTCTTKDHEGETYEEPIDALGHVFVNGVCNRCGAPEQAAAEGGSSAVTLTVTGAEAYETSVADGRYIIAVPAETAVLSGSLGNLKELKAQGVNTIVFRTQLRETVLNIDSMLSLGVDDTLFTLTHNGEGASLTIGGFEHSELIH